MLTSTAEKPVEILLVEDSFSDALLVEETFKEAKLKSRLRLLRDGEDVLAYLRKEGPYSKVIRPSLVLLDLNLPKKSGLHILSEIKNDPDLKRIPVVILTSSEAPDDIFRSYDLHANTFVTKPLDLYEFLKVLQEIENYWLDVAKLTPT